MSNYSYHVLKVGYCDSGDGKLFRADGTITLITGPRNIIVDTGGPWDREFLIGALRDRSMGADDIHYVICTHGHSDHVGNINLFPNAMLIVGFDISRQDEYQYHDFTSGQSFVIDEFVSVIPTPGHTGQDVSVVVKTDTETVAVVGDVFEDEDDEGTWQQLSLFVETQLLSREKVIHLADIIVPGHGKPFASRKS